MPKQIKTTATLPNGKVLGFPTSTALEAYFGITYGLERAWRRDNKERKVHTRNIKIVIKYGE